MKKHKRILKSFSSASMAFLLALSILPLSNIGNKALAAANCFPSTLFFGTVTVDGAATDGASVTLANLTSLAPALTATSSDGGLYLIDSANLVVCAVTGDQIQLSATLGASSASAVVAYNSQNLIAQVDLAISTAPPADTTPPTITITGPNPATTTVGVAYTDEGATAADNVDLTVTVNSTSTVDVNTIGTYTVTYTATDSAGNAAIPVIRTVNVIAAPAVPDTTAPVITIAGQNPVDIIQNSAYIDAGATALDDRDGNITANIVIVNNVNATAVGTYIVTYDVSDAAGNPAVQAVRTVNVVVVLPEDITPPVIVMNGVTPVEIIVDTPYTDAGAIATDNVDPSVTVISTSTVDINTIGTYTVTYTATDSAGNDAIPVIRTVNVIAAPAVPDTTPPVIELVGLSLMSVEQGTAFVDQGATATDNVDPLVNVVATGAVDTNILGTYLITYNASDAAGNAATSVIRTVEVVAAPLVDIVPPVITIIGNNPETVEQNAVYNDAGATAVDDVDGQVAAAPTGLPLDTSATGTFTVVYTATDSAGNSTSSARTVNVVEAALPVEDITPPVITIIGDNPATTTVGAAYNDEGATAADNVDPSVTVISTSTVDINTIGTYTVTYTATDTAGNISTSTREVNVVAAPPVEQILDRIALDPASSTISVGAIIHFEARGRDQNNEVMEVPIVWSVDHPEVGTIDQTGLFTAIATGTATVTASSSDKFNASHVFVVEAQEPPPPPPIPPDTTAPVITILGDNPASVNVGEFYLDAGATATDNVNGNLTASIMASGLPVNTSAPGMFSVVYSVSDIAGNQATATRTVRVSAVVPPQPTLAEISVSPGSLSIPASEGRQLTAEAEDQFGHPFPASLTWTSSNPSVATVDSSGFVTGVSAGTATITARSGNVGGGASVTVLITSSGRSGGFSGSGGGGSSGSGSGSGGGSSSGSNSGSRSNSASLNELPEGRVLGAATSREEEIRAQISVLQTQLLNLLQQLLQILLQQRANL